MVGAGRERGGSRPVDGGESRYEVRSKHVQMGITSKEGAPYLAE